jgi:hypothetical protein
MCTPFAKGGRSVRKGWVSTKKIVPSQAGEVCSLRRYSSHDAAGLGTGAAIGSDLGNPTNSFNARGTKGASGRTNAADTTGSADAAACAGAARALQLHKGI